MMDITDCGSNAGQFLFSHLVRQKLSQTDFAKSSGLSTSHLNRILKGTRPNLTSETINQIVEQLPADERVYFVAAVMRDLMDEKFHCDIDQAEKILCSQNGQTEKLLFETPVNKANAALCDAVAQSFPAASRARILAILTSCAINAGKSTALLKALEHIGMIDFDPSVQAQPISKKPH